MYFLLLALIIASVYPLRFWIRPGHVLPDKSRKFHIALPNALGGIVLVSVWLTGLPFSLKITVTVWKAVLLSVSSYSWKQKAPRPGLMTLPFLFGIYAVIKFYLYLSTAY